jgi:hypothetical protein
MIFWIPACAGMTEKWHLGGNTLLDKAFYASNEQRAWEVAASSDAFQFKPHEGHEAKCPKVISAAP